jgi:phosphoribosylanthranilate isomerase
MTLVKVCGITNLDDALFAVEAGADALGFIFARSPRRITPAAAREIVRRLPEHVMAVGVFRDAPLEEVCATAEQVGVHRVQLHGDESPEYCHAVGHGVIKRFHAPPATGWGGLRREFSRYRAFAYLLDPGAGGGRAFDWDQARGLSDWLIVAGGLNAENVGLALRTLRPFGVDVCSGVEAAPGRKDRQKLIEFIRAVRSENDAGMA